MEVNPSGKATRYEYDYEEAFKGDLNADSSTTQVRGNLVRKTHWEVYDEDDTIGGAKTTPVECWIYNSNGQVNYYTNPEGIVWKYTYNSTSDEYNGLLTNIKEDYDGLKIDTTYGYTGNTTQPTSITVGETTIHETYNALGLLTSRYGDVGGVIGVYEYAMLTIYEYDTQQNLTDIKVYITEYQGTLIRHTVNTYNDCGWLTMVETEYDHDGNAGTAKIKTKTEYIHNDNGLVINIKDYYDGSNYRYSETEYDERGLTYSETKGLNETYETTVYYNYDGNGNVVKYTNGEGKIITSEYDEFGRIIKKDDPRDSVDSVDCYTAYGYDCKACGATDIERYKENGATDTMLAKTEKELDGPGRVLKIKEWLGDGSTAINSGEYNETVYRRDMHMEFNKGTSGNGGSSCASCGSGGFGNNVISGRVRVAIDKDTNYWYYTYDGAGRLSEVKDPNDNETEYTYDDNDNITLLRRRLQDESTSPATEKVIEIDYTYDDYNNRLTATDDASNVTTWTYNSLGQIENLNDANGVDTKYAYDGLGNVLTETRDYPYLNAVTTYTYDRLGEVDTITDAEGNVTDYDYDKIGRLATITYDDTKTYVYTYNYNHQVATVTDPNGTVLTNTYDDLGRLEKQAMTTLATGISGPDDIRFVYDDLHRLLSATPYISGSPQSDGTVSFSYALDDYETGCYGITKTETQPGSKTVITQYDFFNRPVTIAYPSSSYSIENSYTTNGLLDTVNDGTYDLVDYTYVGPLVKEADYENGLNLTNAYNTVGMLSDRDWDGSTDISYDYKWDAVGNKISEEWAHMTTNGSLWTYDALNRMTRFEKGDLNGTYDDIPSPTYIKQLSLDKVHNWTRMADNNSTEDRWHSNMNETTDINPISQESDPTEDVHYVDASATGSNNGNSWTDAYTTIEGAISEADADDEIWVAAGNYTPSSATGYALPSGVTIYGGFSGDETERWQRDPNVNESVMNGSTSKDHLLYFSGKSNVTVEGFTIKDGRADGSGVHKYGGAILIESSCSNITITKCLIKDNLGFEYGGAVHITSGNSSITFDKCYFKENELHKKNYYGGAIYTASAITVQECIFDGNHFKDTNTAGYGAALYLNGGNSAITNCLFFDNVGYYGGVIYTNSGTPVIMNCTITENIVYSGQYAIDGGGTITNCIVFNQQSGGQISTSGSPTVTYSFVEGGFTGTGNDGGDGGDDPDFLDPTNDDFHLASTSDCKDAGTSSGAPSIDLDKLYRGATIDMGCYEYGSTGTVACTYDDNGNLKTDDDYEYYYDFANRLVKVIDVDTSDEIVEYTYDALGRRIQKCEDTNSDGDVDANDDPITYVYSGNQVIEEYDDGTFSKRFVYGAYVDEPVKMENSVGTDYYYATDQQFNVVAVYNSSNEIVERYEYTPHGEVTIYTGDGGDSDWFDGDETTSSTSSIDNPYMFTGRRYDDELGTYYFRARTWDPELGRFTQRDPIGYAGGGMNLYAGYFVPSRVDPSGLFDEEWEEGDGGTWNRDDREMVRNSWDRVNARAKVIISDINKILKDIEKCEECFSDIIKKLKHIRKIMKKMSNDIESPTYNLEIRKKKLKSSHAAQYLDLYHRGIFWRDDELDLNTNPKYNWFKKSELAQDKNMLHELSHGQATVDGDVWYNNPDWLQELMQDDIMSREVKVAINNGKEKKKKGKCCCNKK